MASVVSGGLWYRSVQQPSSTRLPRGEVTATALGATVAKHPKRAQISPFVQFRALDDELENCSLALHIPEYGSEAIEITRVGSEIDCGPSR